MKRIKAACITQTLCFSNHDGETTEYAKKAIVQEYEKYKEQLDKSDAKYKILSEKTNEDGSIAQKTEESIGSYVIHDFTLYYMMIYGFSPRKIYFLCLNAMLKDYKNLDKKEYESKKELFSKEIIDNMKIFYKRFFQQQFKRSCMPDGVKVGSISLSPRADWRMPSDANANLWLDEVNSL